MKDVLNNRIKELIILCLNKYIDMELQKPLNKVNCTLIEKCVNKILYIRGLEEK